MCSLIYRDVTVPSPWLQPQRTVGPARTHKPLGGPALQAPPVASRQAEIVKRLSGICAQIIPFLTQEVSGPRGARGRAGRRLEGWVPQALVPVGGPGRRRLGPGTRGWREVEAEGLPGPEAWLRGLGRVARPLCGSVRVGRATLRA